MRLSTVWCAITALDVLGATTSSDPFGWIAATMAGLCVSILLRSVNR